MNPNPSTTTANHGSKRSIEEAEMPRTRPTGRDWLAIAALAFLAANLLHTADHLRQHLAGVDVEVFLGGGLLTGAAVAVAVIALWRDRRAPLLATVIGFLAALGVAASHIAPHWSALSDSYINDLHPDALSWAVMLLEVGAGFLLGLVGMHHLRAQGRGANRGGSLLAGVEQASPSLASGLPGPHQNPSPHA